MSVEAVQAACRAYMTMLHALKLEINRELDRAQEAKVGEREADLDRAWERVANARNLVLETIIEHES